MTDPIRHDFSLFDWIRRNKPKALRRLSLSLALSGVLLYTYGEVLSYETEIQVGMWLLLAGVAAAMLYKLVSYITVLREK